MPKRVQMTRQRPWRQDHPNAVIVARPSRWGNPWKPGCPGHFWLPTWNVRNAPVEADIGIEDAVYLYHRLMVMKLLPPKRMLPKTVSFWTKQYFWKVLFHHAAHTRSNIPLLEGRDLACWCPLDQPCHADVLLDLANGHD